MIYQICFENYQGETFTELYHQYKNAYNRLSEIWVEAQDKEELEGQLSQFSFFDSDYNEFSTYISCKQFNNIESLFEDKP